MIFYNGRYIKNTSASSLRESALLSHQLYDLILHFRKAQKSTKVIKYLNIFAKFSYEHSDIDAARTLLSELIGTISGGRSLLQILEDATQPLDKRDRTEQSRLMQAS